MKDVNIFPSEIQAFPFPRIAALDSTKLSIRKVLIVKLIK